MTIDIKYYALRFFAVMGALAILSTLSGAIMMWAWIGGEGERPEEPDSIVLTLDFTNPITEKLSDFRFSLPSLLNEGGETPILYITRALKHAKDDPKVKGIIAKFDNTKPSFVHVRAITKALDEFRKSGKFTYAFATSYGNFMQSGNTYLLASYFDNIWLQPVGSVGLSHMAIEAPFGKAALEKFGIQANFLRRAEYKGAMESFSNNKFSPTVRQNMENLLTDITDQKTQLFAQGRKISANEARALIAKGPFTANEALKYKLVTKLGYEDEVLKAAEDLAGKDAEPLTPANYLYFRSRDIKDEDIKGEIAIIYAQGVISDAPDIDPYRFGDDGIINTQSIVDAFEEAAKDDDIKGIIFRVNSPGGSPVASETIRHALVKAKESKKPIYVSMGRVAASGGYWISMDGDKIIADPATITGSIGVLAGKFVLGGLFDKLGITWDKLSIPNAKENMWSLRKPFDEKGKERMNAMLDETYKTFTDHVARTRHIDKSKIESVAKGRVFTGQQAVKLGLVDQVGTLDDAIIILKEELKLTDKDIVLLRQLPAPETPETLLLKMFENMMSGGAMVSELFFQWQQIMTTLAPWLGQAHHQGTAQATLPMSFRIVD